MLSCPRDIIQNRIALSIVTRSQVVGIRTTLLHDQNGLFLHAAFAFLLGELIGKFLASSAEATTRRRIRGTRKIPFQDDPSPGALFAGIGQGDGR